MKTSPTNWMHDNLSLLGSHQLRNIVMPASHDAGMYTVVHCYPPGVARACNTQTQRLSILKQLQAGSRYFDIRPLKDQGFTYTAHYQRKHNVGCYGPTINKVFSDVASYLKTGKDLVILNFSMYYDRDKSGVLLEELLKSVTKIFADHLYREPLPVGGLANVTIEDYIAKGPRLLPVFKDLKPELKQKYPGVYSHGTDLVVNGTYTNTNDPEKMINDQRGKLENKSNHGSGRLFLLSWTLTQSREQQAACPGGPGPLKVPSILDLASQANAQLMPKLKEFLTQGTITPAFVPNLLYVDDFQSKATEAAVWLNQQLLG